MEMEARVGKVKCLFTMLALSFSRMGVYPSKNWPLQLHQGLSSGHPGLTPLPSAPPTGRHEMQRRVSVRAGRLLPPPHHLTSAPACSGPRHLCQQALRALPVTDSAGVDESETAGSASAGGTRGRYARSLVWQDATGWAAAVSVTSGRDPTGYVRSGLRRRGRPGCVPLCWCGAWHRRERRGFRCVRSTRQGAPLPTDEVQIQSRDVVRLRALSEEFMGRSTASRKQAGRPCARQGEHLQDRARRSRVDGRLSFIPCAVSFSSVAFVNEGIGECVEGIQERVINKRLQRVSDNNKGALKSFRLQGMREVTGYPPWQRPAGVKEVCRRKAAV